MHKFLNYRLFFVALVLVTSYANSYINYLACLSQDNKKILLIGDTHLPEICDPEHKKIILNLLKQLSLSGNTSELVLEVGKNNDIVMPDADNLNPDSAIFNDRKNEKYLKLITFVRALGIYYGDKKTNLTINSSDVRFDHSSFDELARGFISLVGLFDFFAVGNKGPLSKDFIKMIEDIAIKSPEMANFASSKTILEALETCLAQISTFKEQLNEKAKKTFEQVEEKVITYKHSIIELFDKHQSKTFYHAFFSEWCNRGNFEDLGQLHDKYMKPFIEDLADVFFLISIIKSQQKHNLSVVFAGAAHSRNIEKYLVDMGYGTIESKEGQYRTIWDNNKSYGYFDNSLTKEEITNLISKSLSINL